MNGPHLRWSCYAIIVNGFVNAFLSFNIVIRNAIFSFVMTKLLTIFIKSFHIGQEPHLQRKVRSSLPEVFLGKAVLKI